MLLCHSWLDRGLVVVLCLLFSPHAISDWRVGELLKSKADNLDLKSGNQSLVVSVGTLRQMNFVFQQICARAEQPASLWIRPGERPNASAAGLGKNRITVNFAMFEMLGDKQDQWAALFGHELAHLKLKHSMAGLKRKVPLGVLDAVIGSKVENRALGTLLGIGTKAVDAHYSQKQETDSDYLGAIWAVEAGYSAWGAVQLHEKLLAQKTSSNYPDFLKSHPSSEERIKTLSSLAKRLDQ